MATEEPRAEGEPTPHPEGEPGKELVDELSRLSKRFVEAVEVAWNSEQRKEVEQDLRQGLKTLADSLERGLHDLGEREETKRFVGKAEVVAETVTEKIRTSETTHELATGLASGLRAVSDRLEKLIEEMQTRTTETPPATPEEGSPPPSESGQDIPIERA